jgi:hypothetical protein
LRTVLGLVAISLLRVLALVLRVFGNTVLYLGILLKHVYDLPLFVPLWLEERTGRSASATSAVRKEG